MNPSHDAQRDAVEQACRETGLELIHAGSVHAYLAEDEDAWPRCCGSACDPCVLALQHTARRALVLLERQRSTPASRDAP